jgi:hypothetical protein
MPETQIVAVGQWAVAIDGAQWILQKRLGTRGKWYPVSFVRSTKAILARCMRENGVEPQVAEKLLASLPEYCDPAFEDGIIPDRDCLDLRGRT